MAKKRIPTSLTDEERVKLYREKGRQNPVKREVNLTPEEEEHWAQVRARIAEARKRGEPQGLKFKLKKFFQELLNRIK